ncbi:TlpA family protein disulfide reductase [Brevibacillus laterosporus]|uniref:TlpA family protein disulfide reductase n=1 Tax=Brevibacillus laterosporus TaxID=1465 RepID=UPI0003B23BFF|nr:TlpA disulfide reductase family protein [Brevibacillus laterosporus]ERM15838.1 thiol-disulfide oxidoreductase [Brevibacillus laterosporus PE36]
MRQVFIILSLLVLGGGAIYQSEVKSKSLPTPQPILGQSIKSEPQQQHQAKETTKTRVQQEVSSQIEPKANPTIAQGAKAPAFELPSMDGTRYKFSGQRQKPLVLNFWASWCGPCRMEAADLQKLYEKNKGNVDFYAINLTKTDDLDSVKGFVDTYKLTMPILFDQDETVAKQYQILAIPTTFIIDPNGVVTYKVMGSIQPGVFQTELDKVVKAKK